jgi:hypothetical protein
MLLIPPTLDGVSGPRPGALPPATVVISPI